MTHARHMISPRPQAALGFTVLELLIGLALLAIVGAVGAPSMAGFVADARASSTASDLHSDLYAARSAAAKLNCDVALAPISSDWAQGWTVSYTAVSATDASCSASGTGALVVLKSHGAVSGASVTATLAGGSSVVFGFDGRSDAGSGVIRVAPLSAQKQARQRCVAITSSGRPSLTVDRDNDLTNGC